MSFKLIKKIIEGIKKLDTEVNDYKKVVKSPYMPSIAYVNWAMHLAQTGDSQSAEEKLIYSTQMGHKTPDAHINLGLLKIKECKFEEAKESFINALRVDGNNPKAYCFLGNVCTELGEYDEAFNNFSKAAVIDPKNTDITINWGISLVRQKKFVEAREKFQQTMKIHKTNYSALYFLALIDLELNELEAAKEKFKKIVLAVYGHHDALYYLSYIYFKEGNYKRCIFYALKSLEFFEKRIETYMLIAESYMQLNEEEDCFKYYELGNEKSRANFYFYVSWGISLQHFDKYQESKEKLEKAVELEPENELGLVRLALSYYKLNDCGVALELLEKVMQKNPENVIALEVMGDINYDNGNYKTAVALFKKALELSAKSTSNYLKLANTYFKMNELEDADRYYKRALEYEPDNLDVAIGYSKFLISQKDCESAIKKLQKFYKSGDKSLELLSLMFDANYTLAKEKLSEYNMEVSVRIADEIKEKYPDELTYQERIQELSERLNNRN